MIRNLKEEDIKSIKEICDVSGEVLKNERDGIYWVFLKFFKNTCFIATENDKIVGFLLGFLSQTEPEFGYIHMLGISPEYQNKGIASGLIEEFGKTIRALGAKKIYLTTLLQNQKAFDFYKRRGFKESEFLKLGQKRYQLWKKI